MNGNLWNKPRATLEEGKRLVAEFKAAKSRRKTCIDFNYDPENIYRNFARMYPNAEPLPRKGE